MGPEPGGRSALVARRPAPGDQEGLPAARCRGGRRLRRSVPTPVNRRTPRPSGRRAGRRRRRAAAGAAPRRVGARPGPPRDGHGWQPPPAHPRPRRRRQGRQPARRPHPHRRRDRPRPHALPAGQGTRRCLRLLELHRLPHCGGRRSRSWWPAGSPTSTSAARRWPSTSTAYAATPSPSPTSSPSPRPARGCTCSPAPRGSCGGWSAGSSGPSSGRTPTPRRWHTTDALAGEILALLQSSVWVEAPDTSDDAGAPHDTSTPDDAKARPDAGAPADAAAPAAEGLAAPTAASGLAPSAADSPQPVVTLHRSVDGRPRVTAPICWGPV